MWARTIVLHETWVKSLTKYLGVTFTKAHAKGVASVVSHWIYIRRPRLDLVFNESILKGKWA
jgi:hypothetical protein